MIENEKVEELMLELEDKTEKTISVLEGEYTAIRAGRANPHVLDRVEVEAYGGMSKLIELGNISALDARCLQISVWDKSLLKAVEKAILQSNLGLTPTNDGNVIRIVFPVMTEERRKELVKQIKKMGEEACGEKQPPRRDGRFEEDEDREGAFGGRFFGLRRGGRKDGFGGDDEIRGSRFGKRKGIDVYLSHEEE